jgi:hypothetical protein
VDHNARTADRRTKADHLLINSDRIL